MKGIRKKPQTNLDMVFSKLISENTDLQYVVKTAGIDTKSGEFVSDCLKEMFEAIIDPNQIECNRVIHKLMKAAEKRSPVEFKEQEAKHTSEFFKRLKPALDVSIMIDKTENILNEREKLLQYQQLCLTVFEANYIPQINLLSYYLVLGSIEKSEDENNNQFQDLEYIDKVVPTGQKLAKLKKYFKNEGVNYKKYILFKANDIRKSITHNNYEITEDNKFEIKDGKTFDLNALKDEFEKTYYASIYLNLAISYYPIKDSLKQLIPTLKNWGFDST